MLALLLAVRQAAAADVAHQESSPTQVFRFHIGKCHLDRKDTSWFSGGRPEVRIAYPYGGSQKTWTSASTHSNAKGLDFPFNLDVDLPLDLDPNAQVHILLIDVGTVWNTTFIDESFTAGKIREKLARVQLTSNLSWIELGIVDPPGRYEVNLERTLVSLVDFQALGGTLPKDPQVWHFENLIASPFDTFKRAASNLEQAIKESLAAC